MLLARNTICLLLASLASVGNPAAAQTARISEQTRVIETYPFSDPNPIPLLTRDPRLYPYHSFEQYARDGVPREWNVVHLENDLIEVFVLPQAGGKVWGAVVKRTGHEFIYRNEVMKFRNIALRGPWTSGGIEFNFGVIGHTPATATPVDYTTRENADGSVSCIVGAMDLPSRTHWRVEIRLPPDRAYFETNVLWYNPTPLEQPYYNWMTAAAFARDDLEMFIPGNAFLEHAGTMRPWPIDSAGRYLPAYADNTFGGHKSYHVVGELNDFFGGYYHDDDYGFGHWAHYQDMPGQKLWLWALSRQGGVWENLLTDTDGQYVEYQAGRLLVQYAPGNDANPITQAAFDPGAADHWSETWFPLEGLGGLTDASRDGAMYLKRQAGSLTVNLQAFGDITDTLHISSGPEMLASIPIEFSALDFVKRTIDLPADADFRIQLPALGLDYQSDTGTRALARPFTTDPSARAEIPPADRLVAEGSELVKARRYGAARELFRQAVVVAPGNRAALLGLADLEYRRGRYQEGLALVTRVLQLDTYDARANFIAGNLYRVLDRPADAYESFGWAARSMAYRSVASVQLAEMALAKGDYAEATRQARSALDYDRYSLPARQVLAMVGREQKDSLLANAMAEELLAIDPLHHFAAAEAYLAAPSQTSAEALLATLLGEYPDQTLLELAVDYARRGSSEDAAAILGPGLGSASPLFRAWRGWLEGNPATLAGGADPTLVFPFRRETIPVLSWAVANNDHWSWAYLLALNLWALDREQEAAAQLASLGDRPDWAPFYATRALLLEQATGQDPETDLRRSVEMDSTSRIIRIHLVRYYQDQGQWQEALTESEVGRRLFPGDFNFDLLQVRSLNELGRAPEAITILTATNVLPSEHARTSHQLYQQAYTLAALDAMDHGAFADAQRYLVAARDWPEHLGQGRPYNPEDRVVRYLSGLSAARLGETEQARREFEAVVAATRLSGATATPQDLLAIPSLVALGRGDEVVALRYPDTEVGAVAAGMVAAVEAGQGLPDVINRLAAEYSDVFADVDGRILLRTLLKVP